MHVDPDSFLGLSWSSFVGWKAVTSFEGYLIGGFLLGVVETVSKTAFACYSVVDSAFVPGIETYAGKGDDDSDEDFEDVF